MSAPSWLRPGEPAYPAQLAAVEPVALSVVGKVDFHRPAIAIVGTRRPSIYGLERARSLAREAAKAGWVVVSGLAYGIDAAAHEACVEAGGTTWAVLAHGLDRVQPAGNRPLARRILASGGCLISEHPPGTPALPNLFLERNRLISGLSWGTILVEGGTTSGALNTARHAANQGRNVYAVLGPADQAQAAAPFILLKEGAAPLRTLSDAWPDLAAYGGCAPEGPSTYSIDGPAGEALSLIERKILQCLGPYARNLEQIGQAAALDIVRLSTILLDMELKGLVQSLPGQRYAKKSRA